MSILLFIVILAAVLLVGIWIGYQKGKDVSDYEFDQVIDAAVNEAEYRNRKVHAHEASEIAANLMGLTDKVKEDFERILANKLS